MENKKGNCMRCPRYVVLMAAILILPRLNATTQLGMEKQSVSVEISNMRKKTYLLGEPVVISVKVRNISEKTFGNVVALEGGWANGKIMTFHVLSEKNTSYPYLPGGFNGSNEIGKFIDFGPGEETRGEFIVSWHTIFNKSGEYTIQGEYIMRFVEGFDLKAGIRSNVINVSIKEPQDAESTVLEKLGKSWTACPMAGQVITQYEIDNKQIDIKYKKIISDYSRSAYTPYVAYFLSDYYYKKKDLASAKALLDISAKQPNFILADNALYKIALCFQAEGNSVSAIGALDKIITEHPDGDQFHLAKKMKTTLERK